MMKSFKKVFLFSIIVEFILNLLIIKGEEFVAAPKIIYENFDTDLTHLAIHKEGNVSCMINNLSFI